MSEALDYAQRQLALAIADAELDVSRATKTLTRASARLENAKAVMNTFMKLKYSLTEIELGVDKSSEI